ncbi:MAG: hypothetical protein NXH97_15565 [Rhodobacteraceae bacterium]|nr:hypothetical protein [Paracoccaceae bacterium]
MQDGPTAAVILELYEKGMTADPAGRARLLCAAAGGDPDAAPLGDVDRAVWALHERLFGGTTRAATATCPHCGEVAEFELPEGLSLPDRTAGETIAVAFGGQSFALRLPRLADVAGGAPDLTAIGPDAPWDAPGFAEAAEAALEAADPGMRLQLELACAGCGTASALPFDIPGWLWSRLAATGPRLIDDVARLARAFGWSEAAILSLSPARRALYLQAAAQ